MMLPQEIIRAKRDGETLSAGEIGDFIAALTSGAVTEGQAAAFAMAIYFRGMSLDERVALTRAMTRSGASLDWRDANLPGPILDKHSTGGVGDNVSLMLAPMLAACGAYVPMISGRGLGHTGGTLDKLNSIPGYTSQPDLALFKRVVKEAGCAIIGQTADLAPADRRLYAIRDVTATVEIGSRSSPPRSCRRSLRRGCKGWSWTSRRAPAPSWPHWTERGSSRPASRQSPTTPACRPFRSSPT